MLTLLTALFILAASCYLLFILSDPLEEVGGRIGNLLRLPEAVIASTFQALATSGPEIIMAVVASTPFIAKQMWDGLQFGERASSGALNMCFSAMDNLLGIGCLAMLLMIYKGTVRRDEVIRVQPPVLIGLVFYLVSSSALCWFVWSSLHKTTVDGREIVASVITESQAWFLASVGIAFILSQFIVPPLVKGWAKRRLKSGSDPGNIAYSIVYGEESDNDEVPNGTREWCVDMGKHSFAYVALVFGLWIIVKECLGATFSIALLGWVSVGGVLLALTSYVSSFPEFMLTYRYVVAEKKSAILGMLFGSNVIDLAFAGFRSMRLHEDMEVYTTGTLQQLFPAYLWALPAVALLILIGLTTKTFKYGHAKYLVAFYLFYIISGFIVL